ncbi:MAG: long-chain fatty acid--CoA ligase [Actinomycetia bacterium]|nr:long-chain fatty acid--CoA ligase [Actinomycetes bacterium]
MVVGDIFRNGARAVPDRVAVVFNGEALTFAELDRAANRTARALGAGHGDRVAVWSSTDLGLAPVFAGLAKAGAVFAPVSGVLPAEEAVAVVQSARPSHLVVDAVHAADGAMVAEKAGIPLMTLAELAAADEDDSDLRVPVQETDPHVIFFTSGSTGKPKGVVLSHRVNVLRCHPGSQLEPRGVMVCPYPLFHMGAWLIATQQWAARERVVFTTSDAAAIVTAVDEHQAARLNCIPGVWRRVLDHLDGRPLESLRFADTGTSATPLDLLQAIAAAAPNAHLRVFYGSTEAGNVAHLDHEDVERKPGRTGVPSAFTEVRVDEAGEVWVTGPLLFDGYFDNPEATAEALVDGWYRTGDLADVDDGGYLSIVGRAKDLIRTGGESVVPAEVEVVLATHPSVRDVAVVGLPDPQWGETVCAVVVGDVTLEELTAHCDGRLARFKQPRRLALVDEIPRTPATNQVQRRLIVEQLS